MYEEREHANATQKRSSRDVNQDHRMLWGLMLTTAAPFIEILQIVDKLTKRAKKQKYNIKRRPE